MPIPSVPMPTIVLVDDDDGLRAALTFSLELDGYLVQALDSGEALLGHLLPAPPACVVIDQYLGGLSGVETLERLRARGVTLPALMITSDLKAGLRTRAAVLGAIIVEKPLFGDVLSQEIKAALSHGTFGSGAAA
jgi:FixJ family two-component response regulator